VIGPSIHINGDVRGEEDLIIEGEVHGTVKLVNNSLTVGREGKVKADVHANSIYVDGHVEGDLYGSERVSVRSSAQVRGNITSPRVSLEEGARFRGSIDMDPEAVQSVLGKPSGAVRPQAAAGSSASAGAPPKSNGNQRPGAAAGRPAETAVKSESPR
jgi:cytoskeletal protein CcmA (bactofilin family)